VVQVVVWDTRSVHTSDDAQALIAARGCQLLWLPPSSPDLSPIEQALTTKTALRRAEALDAAITAARGWFEHCGYSIPAQLI
jgi:transposase